MKNLTRIGRHPIHPMLVPLPIGLWVFSLVADILFRASGNAVWSSVAYYTMAGGIIGALLAALPGLLDFFALKPSPVKKIALWHMTINIAAVILFCTNLYLRTGAPETTLSFVLSIIGVGSIFVAGWLGGQMVYVHGLGVDETEVCASTEIGEHHGAKC